MGDRADAIAVDDSLASQEIWRRPFQAGWLATMVGDADLPPVVRERARDSLGGSLLDAIDRVPDGRGFVFDRAALAMLDRLVPDLVAIRFRYHDGNEWLGEWDGDRGLPRGVEVQVWTSPWPPGMTPAWAPSSDDAVIEDQREVLFDEIDLRSFEETAVDPGDAPAPDRVRVLSILDAAPSDGGER